MIGDHVIVDVSASYEDNKFEFVFPNLDSLGKLEFVKNISLDTTVLENQIILHKRFALTTFDTGRIELPSISFAYYTKGDLNNNSNNIKIISSNSIPLNFVTMDVDTAAGIRDIKSVMDTPLTLAEIIDYIYMGLGLTVLIAFGLWLYKKYFKKDESEVFEDFTPKIPANIIALEQLNKLKAEEVWQSGDYKKYYSRLNEIIRSYIARVYELDAMESTSYELIENLKSHNSRPHENLLQELNLSFGVADMAKFAKSTPIATENEYAWDVAMRFVTETYLQVENDKVVINVKSEDVALSNLNKSEEIEENQRGENV